MSSDHSPLDDHGQHVASPKLYVAIFAALLLGTALTVVAAYQDFGHLNLPIAMLIACAKATLVVLFFMHVKYSTPLVKLMMPTAIVFLAVLLSLLACDYLGRMMPVTP